MKNLSTLRYLFSGIVFSLLPLYSFISWLNVFNQEHIENQKERLVAFKDSFMLFNVLSFVNLLFCVAAIVCFSI
ncbi:hypothetical protein [Corallibacter sp.]|uniref:hypothetical protein n=1 Tax=Corallibacter sp. TaxID=2038084 RepID=UPI003A918F63